jgi:ADP-ribose pyrophosphatase YjhB (NUDIX family)
MPDANGTKVFGRVRGGVEYSPRPAAYAVVRDAFGRVATVRTAGGHFLPGGGSLAGESPEETVAREVREELAREVRLLRELGRAVQHFRADGRRYRMAAVFFAAEFAGAPAGAGEHELLWLVPAEFDAAFFHECHAWAARLADKG